MGDAAAASLVRFGESVYDVLNRVKETIKEQVQPFAPRGSGAGRSL